MYCISHKYDVDKKKVLLLFILLAISSFFVTKVSFAQDSLIEYKIKAGYIYNFTKFISWPKNQAKIFNLCILGKDPFGSIIDHIEKRTVKDKPIKVSRFQTLADAKQCHLIYFSEPDSLWNRSELALSGILTVGEAKSFTRTGGMISFFLIDEKIKLSINLDRLKKSGLEVSAKLLEVAEVYKGDSDE